MTGKPWDNAIPVEPRPWDNAIPVEEANPQVPPSKPFLERLGAGAESLNATLKAIGTDASNAFGAGARAGFGDEPLGLSPESEKWLREHGIIADPANGKGGPLRLLNEAIIRPAATLGDTIMRGLNASVVGASSVIGKRVEQVTGDETAGKQAARDAQNLMNWILIEGGGVLTTLRVTPSGLQEVPLGRLPFVEDFIKTADVLGAPEAKGLLRQLYDEHGIHPAEVAHDAMTDVTIIQDLAAGKLPGYYVKNPEKPGPLSVREAQASDPSVALEPTPAPKPEPPKNELVSRDTTEVLDPNAPKPDLNPVSYEEARDGMRSKVRSGETPKERLTFDQLYTRFVDDLNPIKTALEEAGYTNLPVSEDAYTLHRLTRGSFGKADQMLLNHTYKFDTYENNGRSLKDIISPLGGDLTDFRDYMIAKRALELEARGVKSGFGVDAPKAILSHWKDKAFEWDRIGSELVGYQNRLTLYLRDSGLISQEGYRAMVEMNKNYIPFFRFTDPTLFPKGTGKGLSSRNPLKSIEGAAYDIVDPIESIIRNTYAYVQLAEKNAANLQLIKLLKKWDFKTPEHLTALPKPGNFEIFGEAPSGPASEGAALRRGADTVSEPGPTSMAERMKAAGEASDAVPLVEKFQPPAVKDAHFIDVEFEEVFKHYGIENRELKEVLSSFAREPSGNEIFAFENGRRVSMKTDDMELLSSWRQLDRYSATELTKLLAKPARLLRAGVTLDPAFMARNVMQDLFAAMVNTKGAIFSPISTAKGVRARWSKDVDFQNWLKGGGANGSMVSLDRAYVQESILKLNQDTNFLEGSWNVIKSPLTGLRMLSEFVENATRLGEFEKLAGYRRFGGDPAGTAAGKAAIQAAAMSSREVTLDFARIGAQMRGYSMITAFANAQVQGVDRFARAMKERPFRTSAAIMGGIVAPTVYLWWANHDDPRYKRLESWEKDLFWHFMTENHVFKIRKPLGPPGVIFGAGVERALEAYFDDNPRAFKSFGSSLIASLAPGYIPTLAVPIVEQFANKSTFSEAPIVPSALEKQLPEYQYTPYTTELAKAVGGILGAIPGVKDTAIDASSPFNGVARALTSPTLIENYLRGWTGGTGEWVKNALDLSLRKAGVLPDPPKPEDTLEDLPFAKAFMVKHQKMTGPITDFYEENAKNETVMQSFVAQAREGNLTAVQDIADIYGVRIKLDEVKKGLNDMAAIARMIYKNPDMTPQDKRQQLDTIFMRRVEFAEFGLKILDQDAKRREQIDSIKAEIRRRSISQEGSLSDAPQAVPAGGGTTIQAPPAPKKQPERAGEIRLP